MPRSISSDARYMIRAFIGSTKLDLKPWVHERGLPMRWLNRDEINCCVQSNKVSLSLSE